MRLSLVRVAPILLGLSILSFAACSAKKTASSSDSEYESSGSVSNADKVENSTDDMLAGESEMPGSSDSKSSNGDDPFADLSAGGAIAKNDSASANETNGSDASSGSAEMPVENTMDTSAAVADVSSDTASEMNTGGELKTYRVKAGDTLMQIAFTLYGDLDRWRDLQTWNSAKIKNPNRLTKGMQLKYEAPAEEFQPEQHSQNYVIKKGDTLAKIADEVYGRIKKWKKLQKYNSRLIKNPNVIFAGFQLFYEITPTEVAEADARRQEREMLAASRSNAGVLADTMNAKPQLAPTAKAAVKATVDAAKNTAALIPSVITGINTGATAPAAVAISPVTPVAPAQVTPVTPAPVAPANTGVK